MAYAGRELSREFDTYILKKPPEALKWAYFFVKIQEIYCGNVWLCVII